MSKSVVDGLEIRGPCQCPFRREPPERQRALRHQQSDLLRVRKRFSKLAEAAEHPREQIVRVRFGQSLPDLREIPVVPRGRERRRFRQRERRTRGPRRLFLRYQKTKKDGAKRSMALMTWSSWM